MSKRDDNFDLLVIRDVTRKLEEANVRLDEGTPTITSTETGWEVIDRPHRPGLVRWNGIAPITQDVPILIDGFQTGPGRTHQTVAKEVTKLRALAGIGWSEYDGTPPPVVTVQGAIHHRNARWIISGLSEGESIRNNAGVLVRYHAVVSLTRYRRLDQIKVKRRTIYKVQKGDTLAKIAKKLYGDRKYWRRLGNAQEKPIKNPDKKLKVGRKLRLPKNVRNKKDDKKSGNGKKSKNG